MRAICMKAETLLTPKENASDHFIISTHTEVVQNGMGPKIVLTNPPTEKIVKRICPAVAWIA